MDPDDEKKREILRSIPQVNELIGFIERENPAPDAPRQVLLDATRRVLEDARQSIISSHEPRREKIDLDLKTLSGKVRREVEQAMKPGLRKVINATGVVLHTNIGRSPLSGRALDAIRRVSEGYCNLEYRLDKGVRGSRQEHLESLIRRLTGAEGAIVVNNNAAAVLLVLTALARGRDVIVSRGQLVEIGDSFRLPEIMQESGARLIEVGTTNRTCLTDYSNAIGPETALIMKIHQSNYRIVGYSEEVPLRDLVKLGRRSFIPVIEDLGSGSLVDLEARGFPGEHTAGMSIAAGADLVTFSGDKLLGGPQAGVIAGSSEYVNALRKHPLARAVRIDKLTIAALEATLREYLEPELVWENLPALRMLSEPEQSVKSRAMKLKRRIDRSGGTCSVTRDISRGGGGSLPTCEIPTYCLSIEHPRLSASALEQRLRGSDPAVLARVHEDKVLIDLRTVSDDEVPVLGKIISSILEGDAPRSDST